MNAPQEIVICGLDGVIALLEHRLHHLHNEEGVKHWDRFLAACSDDMPNLPLIDRLNQARAEGVPVILLTGRSSAVKRQTEQWLRDWGIGHDALWMRPAGDFRPAAEFKAAVLEQHFPGARIRRVYESVQHLAMANWCTERTIPCTLVGPNQGNGESREQLDLRVVTHCCDHTMLYPFYGDDDYTWEERLQQLAAAPCRLCQAEEQAAARRQKASEARLAARERGLPPLEGSERQVEWAEGIRLTAFAAIDKVRRWADQVNDQAEQEDPEHWHGVRQGIEKAAAWLEEQVEAKWWIDHCRGVHNNVDGGRALLGAIAERIGLF
jgi:hypothetical protein